MDLSKKIFLVILVLLNTVVLMGQVWPQGAPPFAHKINMIFLSLSLLTFMALFIRKIRKNK